MGFLSSTRLRGYAAILVGGLGLQYLSSALSALFSGEAASFLPMCALSVIFLIPVYFLIKPFNIRIKFVMVVLIFIWWIFLYAIFGAFQAGL